MLIQRELYSYSPAAFPGEKAQNAQHWWPSGHPDLYIHV